MDIEIFPVEMPPPPTTSFFYSLSQYENYKAQIKKVNTGSQMRFYNSRTVPSSGKPYEFILKDPAAADHFNSRQEMRLSSI